MANFQRLSGVYSAVLTPLRSDFTPCLEDLLGLLVFLAKRGCHGALLLGTTGEGPSFSEKERIDLMRESILVRQEFPDFRMLAGTGTPSLDETMRLTQAAFDLGFDGVVVLPPYYYRTVSDEGLYSWFDQVLRRSVPSGGALLGYQIPQVSGVSLSLDLLMRLLDTHPDRFAGIKDSTGNQDHAQQLGERFGKELLVLTGNDRLFSLALENYASGCITAMSNICSPGLRAVWDAFIQRNQYQAIQEHLSIARRIIEHFPPMPSALKALITHLYHFPRWSVRPPLLPFSAEVEANLIEQISASGIQFN